MQNSIYGFYFIFYFFKILCSHLKKNNLAFLLLTSFSVTHEKLSPTYTLKRVITVAYFQKQNIGSNDVFTHFVKNGFLK